MRVLHVVKGLGPGGAERLLVSLAGVRAPEVAFEVAYLLPQKAHLVPELAAVGAPSHLLRTFKGSAALERLLPDVRRWMARAPRAVNRVLRAVVPTRLSFEIAKRVEINGELVDPADFMPYLEGLSRIDATFFGAMLAAAGQHSADDLLPSVEVPTLVIAGARDGFTPPDRSIAMANAIPGSTLLLIEDGSHTTPIERPVEVNQAIAGLLDRTVDPSFASLSSPLRA